MLNTLKSTPIVIGKRAIPFILSENSPLGKKVALQLPDMPAGYAVAIQFDDSEQMRIGRKQILVACARIYGSSRVQTGSKDNVLYVWLKPNELEIAYQVRDHVTGKCEGGRHE